MSTTGLFAGSFDPFTNGHLHVVEKACGLFDKVIVVVGVNSSKKYMLGDKRAGLIKTVLEQSLIVHHQHKTHVMEFSGGFMADFARQVGATHLIRGIRNAADLTDEIEIQDVNRMVDPDLQTVFILPPSDLQSVRSSTIKGLVGLNKWEERIASWVHPNVLDALRQTLPPKDRL